MPIFVIQKHFAKNLHYDFRLEVDDVLKSWAVPKCPSLNPAVKHLAIPTEDHDLDYANFEGIIPEGSYGAGAVMVWDIGTYKNLKNISMIECIKNGKLEFCLKGKKLKGNFALIKTKLAKATGWLLIKMDDKYADRKHVKIKHDDISALTGRNIEKIREDNT